MGGSGPYLIGGGGRLSSGGCQYDSLVFTGGGGGGQYDSLVSTGGGGGGGGLYVWWFSSLICWVFPLCGPISSVHRTFTFSSLFSSLRLSTFFSSHAATAELSSMFWASIS